MAKANTDAEPIALLLALEKIADEIFERWDKDMRSGKLLTALAGRSNNYRSDVTSIRAALADYVTLTGQPSFQSRVKPWLDTCFGPEIAGDKIERNHRFIEEALELVQSTGCTESEAHQLVDYVYSRPLGDPKQEVGGVMNTLAALCLAHGLDMDEAGEAELARVWTKVEKIRAKQATKPKHSPLPAHVVGQPVAGSVDLEAACKTWEFGSGDVPDWDSPLHNVFVAGMIYTERLLCKLLDVTRYEGGDGSEDFDTDATNSLRNILSEAKIYDRDECRFATLHVAGDV